MKIAKIFYSLVLLFLGNIYSTKSLYSSESQLTLYELGLKGYELYEKGDYKTASAYFKQAVDKGDLTFAIQYGDICRRNLDKENHSIVYTAELYVHAAEIGNGEAYSYICSIIPDYSDNDSTNDKVQALVKNWRISDTNRGIRLYEENQFIEAARLLKLAAKEGHALSQYYYADICLRQLDEKPHSFNEAAMWYLLSAYQRNSHIISYLESLVPNLFKYNDKIKLELISSAWVIRRTIPRLLPIDVESINDYIVFNYDRRINRTSAMKLPYYFDKIVCKILYDFDKLYTYQVFKDSLLPLGEDEGIIHVNKKSKQDSTKNCSLQYAYSAREFLNEECSCFTYGPVYFEYFRSLDKRINKSDFLEKLIEAPQLPYLYKLLLDALYEETIDQTANDLVSLSHRDNPWLIAGIKMWEQKHQKEFCIKSINRNNLLEQLLDMKEKVDDKVIDEILSQIEEKNFNDINDKIWINKYDNLISQEFSLNVRKFFISPITCNDYLINRVEKNFYGKLNNCHLTIDCLIRTELENLKSPLVMFYCEKLTLNNLHYSIGIFDFIKEASRYFNNMQYINISYQDHLKRESEYAPKIEKFFKKLENNGLIIENLSAENQLNI